MRLRSPVTVSAFQMETKSENARVRRDFGAFHADYNKLLLMMMMLMMLLLPLLPLLLMMILAV